MFRQLAGLGLVVAMEATSFWDIFTVLVISVVYWGYAIPVAWRVLTDLAPQCADILWYGCALGLKPTLMTSSVAVGGLLIIFVSFPVMRALSSAILSLNPDPLW